MSFYLINKVFFFFQDRVLLCSSGWSRTQHPPEYQDYRQTQATGPACAILYKDLSIFWFWYLREEGFCFNPQVVTNSSHPWDSMLGCWTVKRLQQGSSEGSSSPPSKPLNLSFITQETRGWERYMVQANYFILFGLRCAINKGIMRTYFRFKNLLNINTSATKTILENNTKDIGCTNEVITLDQTQVMAVSIRFFLGWWRCFKIRQWQGME